MDSSTTRAPATHEKCMKSEKNNGYSVRTLRRSVCSKKLLANPAGRKQLNGYTTGNPRKKQLFQTTNGMKAINELRKKDLCTQLVQGRNCTNQDLGKTRMAQDLGSNWVGDYNQFSDDNEQAVFGTGITAPSGDVLAPIFPGSVTSSMIHNASSSSYSSSVQPTATYNENNATSPANDAGVGASPFPEAWLGQNNVTPEMILSNSGGGGDATTTIHDENNAPPPQGLPVDNSVNALTQSTSLALSAAFPSAALPVTDVKPADIVNLSPVTHNGNDSNLYNSIIQPYNSVTALPQGTAWSPPPLVPPDHNQLDWDSVFS